jgi:hypothetical protein
MADLDFPTYQPSARYVPGKSEVLLKDRNKLLVKMGNNAYLTSVLTESSCTKKNCVTIAPLSKEYNSYNKYLISSSGELHELTGDVSLLNSGVTLSSSGQAGSNGTRLSVKDDKKYKGKLVLLTKKRVIKISFNTAVKIDGDFELFKKCPKVKTFDYDLYGSLVEDIDVLESDNNPKLNEKKIMNLKRKLDEGKRKIVGTYTFSAAYSFGKEVAIKIYEENSVEELSSINGNILNKNYYKFKLLVSNNKTKKCNILNSSQYITELVGDEATLLSEPFAQISLTDETKACFILYNHKKDLGASGVGMIPCSGVKSDESSIIALPNNWWWD